MNRKSSESIYTAQVLINRKLFTQSVHCSYYAVIQLMQYKLATTTNNPISYEEQKSKMGNRGGSHEYLLIQIKNRLNSKEAKSFSEGFRNLKSNRVDADYTQREFNDIEGCECKAEADKLIKKLQNL